MRIILISLLISLFVTTAHARNQISIVGSSTVYPFATTVAERLGQGNKFKTPVVESTGTGGGMKLFCAGIGTTTPDITNASRAIKETEKALCEKNGVTPIEYMIGYDGIVIANYNKGKEFAFTKGDIFNAVAEQVFIDGKWVANPYKNWKEINPNFPDQEIRFMLPPPTSGTRDAFVELIMHQYCKKELGLPKKGPDGYKEKCTRLKVDPNIAIMGENDSLIVQKLQDDENRFGIFGFSFLDQNRDTMRGNSVNGVKPYVETIADGSYTVSRPLFFYVKKEHLGFIPGIEQFVKTFQSRGMRSRLEDLGLILLD
jgi:phosphate transport system substrate-binding protein